MCTLLSQNGKRQHLCVNHDKGKLTVLQLFPILKQADSNRRKLTLTVRYLSVFFLLLVFMFVCVCVCRGGGVAMLNYLLTLTDGVTSHSTFRHLFVLEDIYASLQ